MNNDNGKRVLDAEAAAHALYGSGWLELPYLARREAEDFVSVILGLRAADVVGSTAYDVCWGVAEAQCPIYYSEQLAILTDRDLWGWVMDISEGNFETPQEGEDLYHYTCRAASAQYVQALAVLLCCMVDGLNREESWVALGLDADAAGIAAALLPEWADTVAELLEAAPLLVDEAVGECDHEYDSYCPNCGIDSEAVTA